MRSVWRMRLVAAMLVAALLPASFAPVATSVPQVAAFSYAAWLRTQLAGPSTPAVEAALDAAVAAAPASIDAFLGAFAEAYHADDAAPALADLFAAPDDLTAEALLSFLRSRFDRLGAESFARSATLVVAAAAQGQGPERAKALLVVPIRLYAAAIAHALPEAVSAAVVMPLRLRSSARPNGP